MPVKVGASYVSEAAYEFAKARRAEKEEGKEEKGVLMGEIKQKKKSSAKVRQKLLEKSKDKADEEPTGLLAALQGQGSAVRDKVVQSAKADNNSGFATKNELYKYLQGNYDIVKGGMASISGKFLQKCVTDEESRNRFFDILKAADESYAKRKDEVGFQGMQITIDENGEVTSESTKSTVSINEDKRRRQIAAAATKGDMQSVIALLEEDLQQVEDGLKQNMCDEAEVAKAKKLLELAKERMAKLPDRAPTPAEQSNMTVNMLI